MYIRKVVCDICNSEIFKGRVDEEELDKPVKDDYKIQMGNKIIVGNCCHDCAIKIKEHIQNLKDEELRKKN